MGRDKALLPFRGRTLVEWVAAQAREAAGEVRLVGAPERYGHLEIPCVEERYAGCGPLSGIEAALREGGAEWSLVLACDMPGVAAPFLIELLAGAGAEIDAVVAMDKAGRIEPLCAVYGAAALPAVQRALEAGAFAVRGVLGALRIKCIEAPAEGLVRNVNTDEEWAAWSR
jgi:molybdopterin-guanine dinucleotide biosynthesis protein A